MKEKLKFFDPNERWINDCINDYPEWESYYDMIAAIVGCKRSDLVALEAINPENEEGIDITEFFPEGTIIQPQVEIENVYTVDLENKKCGMGCLNIFNVEGIKFVSEQNASPLAVYTSKLNLQ